MSVALICMSSLHQTLHSMVQAFHCPHLPDASSVLRAKSRVSVSHPLPDNPQAVLLSHSFKLNFCGWWRVWGWGGGGVGWGRGIIPFWHGHGLCSILLMWHISIISQCKVLLGFDAMARNGLKSQYLSFKASELIYFLYPFLEQPLLLWFWTNSFLF